MAKAYVIHVRERDGRSTLIAVCLNRSKAEEEVQRLNGIIEQAATIGVRLKERYEFQEVDIVE